MDVWREKWGKVNVPKRPVLCNRWVVFQNCGYIYVSGERDCAKETGKWGVSCGKKEYDGKRKRGMLGGR